MNKEIWKSVVFDFDYANEYFLEVSNYGNLRCTHSTATQRAIKGSHVSGYKVIKLKFYKERDEEAAVKIEKLKHQILELGKKITIYKKAEKEVVIIEEMQVKYEKLKAKLTKLCYDDLKQRTIYYHSLIHRLVADYFVAKKHDRQTVVAHLDFNKLNNRATNLKWMTPEENYIHQRKSPYVIEENEQRKVRRKELSKATKLTTTKVMLLKKLLSHHKPIKTLVKQFKVSETQIYRIKKGENWADIPAAN